MRLITIIGAAVCRTWRRSRPRHAWRAIVRWRTTYLLEQVDEDDRMLRELRDYAIPHGLRALDSEKQELLAQLERFSDGPATALKGAPVPRSAATGGWSPNVPGRVGPLFSQRTHKQ